MFFFPPEMQALDMGSQDTISNADARTQKKALAQGFGAHQRHHCLLCAPAAFQAHRDFFVEVPSFLRTFGGCRCHGTQQTVPATTVGHGECMRQRRNPAVGAESLA